MMSRIFSRIMALLSIMCGCVSLYPHCIVFVHIGKNLPEYFYDAAAQARLFNKTCTIYLLANQQALKRAEPKNLEDCLITAIELESLTKTWEHEEFLERTRVDRNFRDGFWLYTSERFLYLNDFVQQYHVSDIIHLENDNMVYVDFDEIMPIFKRYYKGMGVVFDNDVKCVPGLVFFSDGFCSKELVHYFSRCAPFIDCGNVNDMVILSLFFKEKGIVELIDTLPMIMPEYVHIHGLGSRNGTYTFHKQRFYNHADEFKSIFDGAALGQYFGGIDPRNGPSAPGFVNESCLYDSSLLSYQWIADSEGRKVPYASYNGSPWYRINNLHVHCKNLKQFSSRD